jgi:hypothetical protein
MWIILAIGAGFEVAPGRGTSGTDFFSAGA